MKEEFKIKLCASNSLEHTANEFQYSTQMVSQENPKVN